MAPTLNKNQSDQPLTFRKLEQYNKDILIPQLKDIIDERMQHYTNEILESNDKVIKKLSDDEIEKAAASMNYTDLDERVSHLEQFAKHAAPKVGVAL